MKPYGSAATTYRHRHAQRGQALIEFACFFAFMMLMLAGVTDVAFLEDAHINVVYAAREGARTGAVLGQGTNGANPDCAILGAVQATLQNESDVTVTQITIYKADANGLPTAYEDVYQGNALCVNGVPNPAPFPDAWPAPPTCAVGPPQPPPSCRNITPFQEDSLGVKIDYTFQFRFDLWQSGTLSLSDWAVYPLNPTGIPTPIPSPTG